MCCDACGGTKDDGEKGVCKHCGSTTYGGISEDICGYSPCCCGHCGSAPCDERC